MLISRSLTLLLGSFFVILKLLFPLEGLFMTRLDKVRNSMKELDIDGLIVYSPYNLRYLANFTGTTGFALVTLKDAYFVTDARYTLQAQSQAKGFHVIEHKTGWVPAFEKLIRDNQLKRVGFEADHVSVSQLEIFEEAFDTTLVPTQKVVEKIREVKDEGELQIIRKACSISDAAFLHILNFIKPGVTEIQVANELDFHMRGLGATGVSFNTIIASGIRSSMPHGVASDKVIEKGDLVTLDFGCYYDGYVSDMTRTIAVGEPIDQLKEIHDVVLQAHLKVSEAAGPGKTGVELDKVARDYIASRGYGEYFTHSTGHGIGLEIHEAPNVSRIATQAFVPGNVITNEPGVYLPGIGGVRIEDDIIINETGGEVIQTVPRELIIL